VLSYTKRYKADDVDYSTYISDPDKMIYFTYSDDKVLGQIILRKTWNNYAYIEDIAVDAKFRNCDIGKTLLTHVKNGRKERWLLITGL